VAGDLSAFVHNHGSLKTLQLSVTGARCGGCLSKIEQAVSSLPGIETARLNLSNGRLSAAWHGDLSADRVAKTVSDLGYGVSAFVEDDLGAAAKREERQLLMSMGVAGFAAANIMLLSVSVWAGHGEMGETTRRSLHALSGIIALPVLLFSGRHFFRSALSALKAGHANMDVPISLALVLAYSVSVWETVRGGPHAYFDACAMLIFFLLIGRFLDARLRRQAHAAAHRRAALRNRAVKRLDAAGQVESIKAQDVRSGDTIILAAGERAVIDLIVTQGNGSIDESLVTGESLPRTISQGQILYAGSINIDQPLQGRARGEAGDSLLSEIADMLEAGEQQRSAYRRIADRAVGLYVPFVHSAALLAFLTWVILGASVGAAIMIAVSTLIITCPCALALAAPVTQVVASGRLHRQGVFLRSGDALERLAEIDHVVFDKTGTLTLGEPVLASQHAPYELMAAARLARASRHPLSRALVNAAGPGQVAAEVKETAGLGLEATIDGALTRLGSAEWVGANADTQTGAPSIWYVEGDADPVLFRFEDRLRDDALASVGALKAAGLDIEILSGDQPGAVEHAAATLGIDQWTARVSPSQKGARLKVLREEGRKVLMIGDGLN
ncbi:MAG: heavy metal translocating P-type ATPase, partial [Pseudomonadota bacterium]